MTRHQRISHLPFRGFFPLVALACFFAALFTAAGTPASAETPAQFAITVQRTGNFLAEPTKEQHELMRRLGRSLEKHWGNFEQNIMAVAGFELAFGEGKSLKKPLRASEWTPAQKEAVGQLWAKSEPVLAALGMEIKEPSVGLFVKGAIDAQALMDSFTKLLDNPQAEKKLRPGQMHKLRNRILPFLTLIDTAGFLGSLSSQGFRLRTVFRGTPEFTSTLCPNGSVPAHFTYGSFIPENALIAIGQVHEPQDPETIIEGLKEFPQYRMLEAYLASASLDLGKDILSNPGLESLVTVNLEPNSEGGLPDVRMMAKVKDPAKLLFILPNLKTLASNLGIFVTPQLEGVPSARLSLFLAPQFAVHVTLLGDQLLIAGSKENLTDLANHIESIRSGKSKCTVDLPEQAHRFWRVNFSLLNAQVQRIMQSPLLADKGIPPIPNLNVAGELGDLTLVTRLFPERLEMDVTLPLRDPKPEK